MTGEEDQEASFAGLEAVLMEMEMFINSTQVPPKYKSKYHLQLHSKYDLRI